MIGLISFFGRFKITLILVGVSLLTGAVTGYKICAWADSLSERKAVREAHRQAEGHLETTAETNKVAKEKIRFVTRYIEKTGNRECLTDEELKLFNQ